MTLAVMLLSALPALAQTPQVTFQVDLTAPQEACAFLPDSETPYIKGSFDDWGTGQSLADDDGDGVYATTLELEEGTEVFYKFFVGETADPSAEGILGWENDPNRSYTVTADAEQTIDAAQFNKEFNDLCNAETASYEVEFRVDMSVAELQGLFDPSTQTVAVRGSINDWGNTGEVLELQQDFINTDIYTGIAELPDQTLPSTITYKFWVGDLADLANSDGYESGENRVIELTGDEPDVDDNGLLDVTNTEGDAPYFGGVGPDEILSEAATMIIEVDLRPAFYHLADSTEIPVDTQSGNDAQTEINALFINGPIAGFSTADEASAWVGWGEELAGLTTRQLVDDGSGDDTVAGDSIYTITLNYNAGTPIQPIGKFGINGFDNEGTVGANHNIPLEDGTRVHFVFGATLLADGRYTDDRGPGQQTPGDYDPYILIDNDATPPTVIAVRRGGEEDGVNTRIDPIGGEVPSQVELGTNYPNPFNPSTSFEYRIDATQHVRVQVFDLLGRSVATLVDGVQSANTYRVTFDASNLASGIYLYQLEAGGNVITKTMTLLK